MFSIDKIKVGENYPPVVIAEIGINHNGNLDLAIELADSAIKSGIEIIKHQTHIIEDEMSLEAKKVIPGNSKQSIFDIISKYWFDFILLSACFSVFFLIWRRQTE